LVSETEPAATGPVEELLSSFRGYLASERGLTTGTIEGYERGARVFLEDRVARAGALELERLTTADVSGFLARECPRRSVSAARDLAARLRQLLRYLHVAGLIDTPLVWAVPPVADLRGRSLPKAVVPAVITAMLASCDLEPVIGRRDFAVLLLLARLGLRAGRSPRSDWMMLIGVRASCSCMARGIARTRCPCRSTSATRWSGICGSAQRASIARSSCWRSRRSGLSAATSSR